MSNTETNQLHLEGPPAPPHLTESESPTALVPSPTPESSPSPPRVPEPERVLIARDPAEMQKAQGALVLWARSKIHEYEAEVAEVKQSLEIAKKRKWRTSNIKRQLTRSTKRLAFYHKVKAALDAGYCLVPNLPADVFAVRTTARKPRYRTASGAWAQTLNEQTTSPPIGEGEYVSDQTTIEEHERLVKRRNNKGEEIEVSDNFFTPEEHLPVQFPFALAKPQIVDDTSRAMALKVFDEFAVLPERRSARRKGDPIIVGTVKLKEGTYQEKHLTFLVSWFIDIKDLP